MRGRSTDLVDVVAALDRLELESNKRREELRRIAAELPATISRRALVRTVVADLRAHPDKQAILRRGVGRVGRAPLHAAKRIQLRMRSGRAG